MERLTERKYGEIVSSKRERTQIHCSNFCNNCSQGTGNCDYVREMVEKLAEYEDAEEQGLLLRLDSKDKLIEVLATKLLNSEFGSCYMCTNPMKNIALDGVNNGCDGGCNTSEEFTVDDFLKKIVEELQRKEEAEQKLAEQMKEV